MTRLTSSFWVQAYLRRLSLYNIPAFVTSHGDDNAGTVLIKLNTLDGMASAYTRQFNLMTGARAWEVLSEGGERDVDDSIAKQRSFDPDLWVIEVEDREGRHLLDQEGLDG